MASADWARLGNNQMLLDQALAHRAGRINAAPIARSD